MTTRCKKERIRSTIERFHERLVAGKADPKRERIHGAKGIDVKRMRKEQKRQRCWHIQRRSEECWRDVPAPCSEKAGSGVTPAECEPRGNTVLSLQSGPGVRDTNTDAAYIASLLTLKTKHNALLPSLWMTTVMPVCREYCHHCPSPHTKDFLRQDVKCTVASVHIL